MTAQVETPNMSPDDSPNAAPKKAGVRRVNNMPLFMVLGGVGLFILMMMWVAKDRSDKQHAQEVTTVQKEGGGNSEIFAKQVAAGQTGAIVPASRPDIPPASSTVLAPPGAKVPADAVRVAHPTNLDAPPAPPRDSMQDNELEQIRQSKFSQFGEAVRARTSVSAQGFRSPGSAPGGPDSSTLTQDDLAARLTAVRQQIATQRLTDPTAAFKAQLAALKESGIVPTGGGGGAAGLAGLGGGSAGSNTDASGNNNINRFAGDGKADRWALNAAVTAPVSPYVLRAGAVIPATLISGINSELPGQIMAQVSQNVYDTATGKYLLVPQGSRLIGTYASEVAYGQSRVLVAWQRIVFPDGKALDIGAMPGADPEGYAGFHDKVNNHYLRIFTSALLMSAVTAGIEYSQNSNQSTTLGYQQQSASSALSEATGQQLGMATAQMLEKNLNIAPTLEIRPGFRFNVVVTKDLTATKPYQPFDY